MRTNAGNCPLCGDMDDEDTWWCPHCQGARRVKVIMYTLEIKTGSGNLVAVPRGDWWVLDIDGAEVRCRRGASLPELLRSLGYEEPFHFTAVTVR